MAITWQNVGQASEARAAASLYNGAQRSFDTGFSALNKVMDQAKDTRQRNSMQRTENNTQDALDRIASVQSTEGWENGRGGVDELLEGMGNRYDREAVREALAARPGQIRKEQTAQDTYNDQQLTRKQKPIVDGLRLDALNGNWDRVSQGLADNELVNEADLAEALYGNYTTNRNEYRAGRQDSRAERTTNQTISLRNSAEQRARYAQNIKERNDSRKEEEYQLGERVKDAENAQYQAYLDRQEETRDKYRQASEAAGIPLDSDGRPRMSEALPRQRLDFLAAANELGLNDLPTQSEQDRDFKRSLFKSGVDASDLAGPVQAVAAARQNDQALSPEDLAQIQERQSALDLAYNRPIRLFGGGSSNDPQTDAAEVLGDAQDEDGFLLGNTNDKERQAITNDAVDLLANGITIDGTTVPVTKATLRMATSNVVDDWGLDSDLKSIVREQYKKLGMVDQFDQYRKYRADSRGLTESAKADFGVGTSRDEVRALFTEARKGLKPSTK